MTTGQSHAGKLGTFAGVFTPSILTILGLILFLRLGYVVGWAGVGGALAILGVATLVSVLTSVSLSAIATNLKVKKGGDYYLISRTLGPEFGGAIGAVLFLAQAISVAFYVVGFAEALTAIISWDHPQAVRLISVATIAVLFAFAWLGSDWASKLQLLIMGVLIASLFGFFAGAIPRWDISSVTDTLRAPTDGPGLAILFAIFFPAVTGFSQGAAMSGDLKDASRSLPNGTFAAVGLSTVVYAAAVIVLAGSAPRELLQTESSVMRTIALRPWLIDAGVIAATISSAMASFLGAPRILQSLAQDKIIRVLDPFAKTSGAAENPRRALMLTLVIALGVAAVGQINLIAPVVSMFFLLSYGLLNYATWFDATSGSPSFRPTFRYFNRWISLAGACLCAAVMLIIDVGSAIVAAAVLFALYQFLRRTAGPARWADSARSYSLRVIRKHLFQVAEDPADARDWRPHILAFSDDQARRERLLTFASWIEGGVGLTTAVRIVTSNGPAGHKQRKAAEKELAAQVRETGLGVFSLAVLAPDVITGARQLLQGWGVGPVRANLILLNWLEQAETAAASESERRYGESLQAVLRLSSHVVALEAEDDEWAAIEATPAGQRRIDVWWFDDASSRLALLLAYLMTRSEMWEDATIQLCVAVGAGEHETAVADAEKMLADIRIEAEVVTIESAEADKWVELSCSATIVLCPFRVRQKLPRDHWGGAVEPLVCRLPVTALIIAGEDIVLASDPDTGSAAQAAAEQDKAESAQRRADLMEERATEIAEAAEKEIADLYAAAMSKSDDLTDDQRATRIAELHEQVRDALRRAIKAKARVEPAEPEKVSHTADAGSQSPGAS